jgi:hypothetical protein
MPNKTQTKPTDDLVGIFGFFKFFHELRSPGKSDLVDVFFDLIGRHAKPLVEIVMVFAASSTETLYFQVAQFFIVLTKRSQPFDFLRGIHRVAHQLPQKDLMIGV